MMNGAALWRRENVLWMSSPATEQTKNSKLLRDLFSQKSIEWKVRSKDGGSTPTGALHVTLNVDEIGGCSPVPSGAVSARVSVN